MDNKSANEPITMPTIASMGMTFVVDCTGGVILREMIRCGDRTDTAARTLMWDWMGWSTRMLSTRDLSYPPWFSAHEERFCGELFVLDSETKSSTQQHAL